MLVLKIAERIANVIWSANIMGLKASGAPNDEFETEALYIVSDCLRHVDNVFWDDTGQFDHIMKDIIDNVFQTAFEKHGKLSHDVIDKLTSNIRQVINEERSKYFLQLKKREK